MTRCVAAVGLLLVLLLGGCAQVDKAIFDMNLKGAQNVFQPMARGYRRVVPEPIRKGLRHATDNLRYTDVMVNNALQGKFDRAASDLGRIVINWICFAGLFDAASDIGIPKYDEDLGQTLGFHGFGPGPYFNVPFLGPSTLRDVTQYPFRIATNPMTWGVNSTPASLSVGATSYLFQRFDDVEDLDPVLEAVDPYAFVKEAYLERREFLIHDGNPPGKSKEEEKDIDEALKGLEDLEEGSDGAMDDLEDLDGLDGAGGAERGAGSEDPERAKRVEGSDLRGLDDLEGLEDLEAPETGAGGLPPPQIIIRRTASIPGPIEVIPASRFVPPAPQPPPSSGLPPPVVRKR